jgi:hypothetical protein
MTAPQLTPEEILARLVLVRDWCTDEAAYYRRRPETRQDRQLAIQLEDWVRQLDEVIANLRMRRRTEPTPG